MLELFETPLTVLHIVVCFFLILVVLIQPGKSGGLGAALGGAGAQQVFGGRGAGNFLSRVTWICAGLFFVTSMVLAYVSSSADDTLEERAGETPVAAGGVSIPAEQDSPQVGDTPAEQELGSQEDDNPEPASQDPAEQAPLADPPLSDTTP